MNLRSDLFSEGVPTFLQLCNWLTKKETHPSITESICIIGTPNSANDLDNNMPHVSFHPPLYPPSCVVRLVRNILQNQEKYLAVSVHASAFCENA